ncbi:MAG: hypothetical protein RR513_09325 [Muribaculaceae bacterium]
MAIVNARIKIGDGHIQDLEHDYGFLISDCDKIMTSPIRDYETQQYPEKAGVKIDPRITLKEFDYKISFIYFSNNEYDANIAITKFYNSLFTPVNNSDIKIAKSIIIYNDYMGNVIQGYAKTLPPVGRFYRNRKDVVEFSFTIFVNDPNKCKWIN